MYPPVPPHSATPSQVQQYVRHFIIENGISRDEAEDLANGIEGDGKALYALSEKQLREKFGFHGYLINHCLRMKEHERPSIVVGPALRWLKGCALGWLEGSKVEIVERKEKSGEVSASATAVRDVAPQCDEETSRAGETSSWTRKGCRRMLRGQMPRCY
ncbi:hypothetical protein MMC13_008032 [Lambiella insularis]|nr:hypothetical protein [Lambiella insularis]